MGFIILNALLATGLLYSIASPFLAHIQNKISGYHNFSIQFQSGIFPDNEIPNYNPPFPPDIINRGDFPESNYNPNYQQDYIQNPLQENAQHYPPNQAQYFEEYSQQNPVDNSQGLSIDNSQQQAIDNSQPNPIDNSEQHPEDNYQGKPIDNLEQYPEDSYPEKPIDNSQKYPIDNSEQFPIDNSEQYTIDNLQGNPIDKLQENPIDNLQGNPVDNLQGNPIDNLQENPIDNIQGNPIDNLKGIPIDYLQGNPVDNLQGNPIDDVQGNPIDDVQGNPIDNSQQDPIDNSQDNPVDSFQQSPLDNDQENPTFNSETSPIDSSQNVPVESSQFIIDDSQSSQDSDYQMDAQPENVSEEIGVSSRLPSLAYLPVKEDVTTDSGSDLESSIEDDKQQPEFNTPINPQDCARKSCFLTAANYLKNMDESVDPCDDFYQFACGNYAVHNPLKGDDTAISELTKAKDGIEANLKIALEEPIAENEPEHFKSLKKYYKACIDENKINSIGLDTIKSHLEALGGWPVTGKDNDHDWVYVIYGLSKLGISPNYLFEFFVDTDYKNTTIRILSLSPAEYPLQRETIVNGRSDKNVMAYLNYMIATAKLFGATDEDAKNDMEMALDFEIALANNSKSIEEIRSNLTALYNVYSIAELEKEFPEFPWFIYINTLTPQNVQIVKDVNIILTEPEYARKLFVLLRTTPKRTVINYIIWRAIYDLAKFLNTDMRNLNQNFFAEVLGKQSKSPRHTECIETLRERLNPLSSALYVRKYFNVKSKEAAIELTKYIKSTFKTILNRTNWSAKDKATAVEKAEAIQEHIGFPEELLDNKELENIYGMLDIKEDDYLYSTLKLLEFKRDFEFNRLFEPVNKTFWMDHADSADSNAYYNVAENSIILPAGILQGSYFNSHVPMFVNFAAIGSVIGHEITHGFDDVGHQFNKNGDLGSIWSEEAENDFAEKKQCVIDQFNMFTVFGKPYNGGRTVGENLADFGGQKTAYISYIKWMRKYGREPKLPGLNYTIKQQYWIAGANIWCSNEREEALKYKATVDTHALVQFRVNAPLSNIPNFAMDFNCPVGSKMNPVTRCTPW